VYIAASLASAPLDLLRETLKELEQAPIDALHFDIEDGTFVPCMTLGTKLIGDLRPYTRLPFDVHLMMHNPEWLLPDLARMGANRISVHFEACPYPRRILRGISSLGVAAGLAFNPSTPIPDLSYLSPYLSFVLILTTEPEVPDAPYLPESLDKLREAKSTWKGTPVEWVVDGGIDSHNLALAAQAGADAVVVGRAIFNQDRIRENIGALRAAVAA
jgi:ribulose-phosphate 3-epimerase